MRQHQEQGTNSPASLPQDPPGTSPFLVALLVLVGALAPLLWGAVAWQLLVEMPQAVRMFRDFNLKLPLLTEWALAFGWVVALGVFVVGALACALAAPFRRARGLFAVLLVCAGVVAPVVLNLTLYLALQWPEWKLMEGLSR